MIQSLSEAISEYQNHFDKRLGGEVRSLIKTRVLPELLILLNRKDLQNRNLDFVFDQISIAGFIKLADPIVQASLLSTSNRGTRKVTKSVWKKFCVWLQQEDGYSPEPAPLAAKPETIEPEFVHIPDGLMQKVENLKQKQGMSCSRYSLSKADLTPHLQQQYQEFSCFCTTLTRWRRSPVRAVTLKKYQNNIRRILGYLKNIEGVEPALLDLKQLVEQGVLKNYETWCRGRGVSSQSIREYLGVAVPVAKWLFNQSAPDENYEKAELVKQVRGFVKEVADLKDRPLSSDAACAARATSPKQNWEILRFMRWRCKDLEKQHGLTAQVIDAWMDFLILAILITTGVRQREIRELLRKHLRFEARFIFVHLPPEGHKTGSKTDRGREYPLFVGRMEAELREDFLYYLDHIRPQDLDHDYVFFVRQSYRSGDKQVFRGDPIPDQNHLSELVSRRMAVVTAHLFSLEQTKWTTPHDFRRIIATWICTYGRLEDLPPFAEMLGHDVKMLIDTYNKMHPGQLARQVPIAFAEIAKREMIVERWQTATEPDLTADQSTPEEQVKVLEKLVWKLWNNLTPRKQQSLADRLTPLEQQVLAE